MSKSGKYACTNCIYAKDEDVCVMCGAIKGMACVRWDASPGQRESAKNQLLKAFGCQDPFYFDTDEVADVALDALFGKGAK